MGSEMCIRDRLRTQVDPRRRRCARVRCVVLRAPRASGGQAYLVKHASHKEFSWSHYLTQMQQPTDQRAQLLLGRNYAVREPLMQRVAEPLHLLKRNGNGHCDGVDVPPKHAQNGYPTARSYVEPTERDPVRISPQRADIGPTRETRTRVDSAGHRATIVPPPICLLYTSPSPRDGLLSRMPSSA